MVVKKGFFGGFLFLYFYGPAHHKVKHRTRKTLPGLLKKKKKKQEQEFWKPPMIETKKK